MTNVRRSGAPRRADARVDTSKEGSQGKCNGGVGGYGTVIKGRDALPAQGIAEGWRKGCVHCVHVLYRLTIYGLSQLGMLSLLRITLAFTTDNVELRR